MRHSILKTGFFFFARANESIGAFQIALFLCVFAAPISAEDSPSAQIKHRDPQVRIAAAEQLKSKRTDESAGVLNAALASESEPMVQMALMDAVASMPERGDAASFARFLNVELPPLRKRAAYVLGLIGGAKAEAILAQALSREADPGVKAMILQSLSVCGSENSVAAIENAMQDSRPHVRRKAAETLRYIPGDRAEAALNSAANDQDPDVRKIVRERRKGASKRK